MDEAKYTHDVRVPCNLGRPVPASVFSKRLALRVSVYYSSPHPFKPIQQPSINSNSPT